MGPFIGLLIIVLVVKAAIDKGRREYRATRDHHAAQIARAHPDWHHRHVQRAASRRAASHWWNEINAWPPFPSFRAQFAEDRMTAKVAAAEARAAGAVRWRDLHERLGKALAAQREHERGEAPLPAAGLPGEAAGAPPLPSGVVHCDPAQGASGAGARNGEQSCYWCGFSAAAGMRSCAGHPGKWECADAEACRRRSDGPEGDLAEHLKAPMPEAHTTGPADGLYDPAAIDDAVIGADRGFEDWPEPGDDWPTGIPHRRNGDAPSPAMPAAFMTAGELEHYRRTGEFVAGAHPSPPAPNGNNQEGEPVTGTDFDTALEGADTPHEAMQGAFRQAGASAAKMAQAVGDDLAAAAAVHGMDRDPQTMADIADIADQAAAIQARANQAAAGLASRHADGAEYHGTGSDAHASAFRPS